MGLGAMTCLEAIDEFHGLVREAHAADMREEPIEPHLVRVLTAIRNQPECRAEYGEAFRVLIVSRQSIPWELVPFCMHELRWDEVKETIEERFAIARKENDWRATAVLSKYRDAFDDYWDSADLFAYYTQT